MTAKYLFNFFLLLDDRPQQHQTGCVRNVRIFFSSVSVFLLYGVSFVDYKKEIARFGVIDVGLFLSGHESQSSLL